MTRRCAPSRLAAVKRQMLAIENALNDMSRRVQNKERGDKLASVADAVTDLRACDLWKPNAGLQRPSRGRRSP
jgi:hypothetical protein